MRGYLTDPDAPDGLRLADDLPEPSAQANEVVVEIAAYSVNRGELFLLTQRTDGWRPGQDIAGAVTRTAADGTGPAEGTRVVAILDGAGWSERAAVPTTDLASLPDGVDWAAAASLPIAGLTALRALRRGGDVLARRVLVTGATGGVGQFAVALAAAAGAHVTAQVSGPDRTDEARSLGAHEVVTEVDGSVGPFALVLDGVGGRVLVDAVHRLEPGAVAVTYAAVGDAAPLGLADFGSCPNASVVGFFHAYPIETRGADLATLVALVADGRLDPRIGLTRDWSETVQVIGALRERAVRGKAVLTRD